MAEMESNNGKQEQSRPRVNTKEQVYVERLEWQTVKVVVLYCTVTLDLTARRLSGPGVSTTKLVYEDKVSIVLNQLPTA